MNEVIEVISTKIGDFFIITNKPYKDATDYYRRHPLLKAFSRKDRKDGIRLTFRIHKIIRKEVAQLDLHPKKIGQSNLEIDLWDEVNKIAYEIILGNGDEIWKDILKALLVEANKLVVFCRDYPDSAMRGYGEIERAFLHLKPFLRNRFNTKIVKIIPTSFS